jgi:hypothetical protein
MKRIAFLIAAALVALGLTPAQAQDKLKIGIITTLTGPPAVLGGQLRNGFQLAVKTLGGKLGGREAEIIVADDELKPDVAISKVKAFVERDKVDFVVGPTFSNILQAIMKPVADADTILISPNAGTSNFAGKECNPNLFVTSYQNDQVHEVLGKYAQDSGIKKVFLMAPNYQAGKDSLNGFKHYFKGEILDEVYVPLGQLDYQAELTRIAAAQPDANARRIHRLRHIIIHHLDGVNGLFGTQFLGQRSEVHHLRKDEERNTGAQFLQWKQARVRDRNLLGMACTCLPIFHPVGEFLHREVIGDVDCFESKFEPAADHGLQPDQ